MMSHYLSIPELEPFVCTALVSKPVAVTGPQND